eukprot:6560333-Prymnesium_polylepis.1
MLRGPRGGRPGAGRRRRSPPRELHRLRGRHAPAAPLPRTIPVGPPRNVRLPQLTRGVGRASPGEPRGEVCNAELRAVSATRPPNRMGHSLRTVWQSRLRRESPCLP